MAKGWNEIVLLRLPGPVSANGITSNRTDFLLYTHAPINRGSTAAEVLRRRLITQIITPVTPAQAQFRMQLPFSAFRLEKGSWQ